MQELGRPEWREACMNDCERVVSYCKQHGSITQMEATLAFGCTRLGARIWDLKHGNYGVTVTDVWEEQPDRFGVMSRYKRYFVEDMEK